MKCKNDETVKISKQSMDYISKDKLKNEITSHAKCINLSNIDHVLNYFISELNYGWNEEQKKFCTHLREGEVIIPDGRTVHDHIDSLLSDSTRACLLATRAEVERYERPASNPWIRGAGFSLKLQASVWKHEQPLARRWKHEATAINAQVSR